MVKTILKGGLGNQMFQYAAGKALALEKNTGLYLDLSYLKTRPPIKDFTLRNYELNLFGVRDKAGSLFNNDFLDRYFSYTLELLYNKFLNGNYFEEGSNPYAYHKRFFDLASDTTLEGYWTNIKYFEKYSKEIKNIFDLDKFYDKNFHEIETKIKSKNSVSINIRRGDYLNNKHKDTFVILREDYYKEAIGIIRSKVKNPHFFVFSYDDPKWFADTFKMNPKEYTMMSREYVGDKFKTYLRLISLCEHNIISNSTFAWWGAYLNKHEPKIVISPTKWMYQYNFDVPTEWIGIDNK